MATAKGTTKRRPKRPAGPCEIDGCDRNRQARGWCHAHYAKYLKYGDPLGSHRRQSEDPCKVDGCEKMARARGWCASHYNTWKRTGEPVSKKRSANGASVEERFKLVMSRIDPLPPNVCWPWPGAIDQLGYGRIKHPAGKLTTAHRAIYEIIYGPVGELVIDHVCHNDSDCDGGVCEHRRCVNPAHLEAVTRGENVRRGQIRLQCCRKGHALRGDNVRTLTSDDGRTYRECKTCKP